MHLELNREANAFVFPSLYSLLFVHPPPDIKLTKFYSQIFCKTCLFPSICFSIAKTYFFFFHQFNMNQVSTLNKLKWANFFFWSVVKSLWMYRPNNFVWRKKENSFFFAKKENLEERPQYQDGSGYFDRTTKLKGDAI